MNPVIASMAVAPGFTAGRGLKRTADEVDGSKGVVAPGFTAGRGLKPEAIERRLRDLAGSARLHGRARIETSTNSFLADQYHVAPGFTAGRGLKLSRLDYMRATTTVAPGFTAGRGLKRYVAGYANAAAVP